MSVYTVVYLAKKGAMEKHGAKHLATAIEANNAKTATAKAVLLLEEEMPESSEYYFSPKVVEDQPGQDRPALNVLDETFMDTHTWNDEIKIIETIEQESTEEEPETESDDSPVNYDALSPELKIATLVKFGTHEIKKSQLTEAVNLAQDKSATFDGHIVEALNKTPSVAHMCPTRINDLIIAIRINMRETDKWPTIAHFAAKWVANLQDSRKTEKTSSGASAGGGILTDRNPDLKHSLETLKLEIAMAMVARAMDFDIYEIPYTIANRGREIIKLKERPLSVLYNVLSNMPGILNYSRALIISSIKTMPEGLYLRAEAPQLQDYFNRVLIEKDPARPDAAVIAAACGQMAEARTEEKEQVQHESAPQEIGDANVPEHEQPASDTVAAPAANDATPAPEVETVSPVTNLGGGKFSVEGLTEPAPAKPEEQPEPTAPTFQSVAEALEKDLPNDNDNLYIWRQVMRTDPRYTKQLAGAGFDGTSINPEYMIMRATQIFGPIGSGWGYEVIEDKMLPGAPMSEAVYENNKFICNRMLRDGDGTLITEQNHSLKIRFWYIIEGEIRGEIESYGATKYLYKTKGGITCDGEAQKKSLTDAIKKALSLLGFSADVWLGLYDQAEYKQENKIEFDIKNASERAEDVTRLRSELDEKFKQNVETMRSAVTTNEVSKIASSLTRVIGVHLKAARDKADDEYAKYLEGRLHRLEAVKSECLAKLQEAIA